jgi:hypothetical protein
MRAPRRPKPALTGGLFLCLPSPEATSRARHERCAAVDAAMSNPGPGAPVMRNGCAAVGMPNPGRAGIVKPIRVPGLPPVRRNRSLFIDRAMSDPQRRPRACQGRRRIQRQAAGGHDGGSQGNSNLMHHDACSHSVHPGLLRANSAVVAADESQRCGIVAGCNENREGL